MKKLSLHLLMITLLTSCSNTSPKTVIYQYAFEQILFENGAYFEEVDYISIFINEDDVPDERLTYLQKALKEIYEKKVYKKSTFLDHMEKKI